MTTPKIDTTNKVDQQNMGLSMKSSNPNEFPILYNDDVWDVIEENSALAEKLGGGGQFDQHQINEALAEKNIMFCIEIGRSSSGEDYIFVNQPNYSILNNFVDNNNSNKIVPYVIYGNDIYQLANCVKKNTGNLVFDFSKNGDKFTLEYVAVYEEWTVTRTSINSSSTLDSNAYNNLGIITSNVTLELPEFESGAVPEFNGQFSIDTNSSYRVTFPIDVQCYGDTTQSYGHTYLFSIKNSICLILELTD